MILDRELRYAEVNEAYLQALERSREELIGRNMFEVFPNDGESGRVLRASFERVLETGEPHSIAYIPYPIRRPAAYGGGYQMRYWSAAHTPLLDENGEVMFILQNTVDVTELHDLKQIAYGPDERADTVRESETQLLQRAAEVQQANRSLLQETTQLRDLFMQAPGFMAVVSHPDLTISFVNKAFLRMVGSRQLIGRKIEETLPEFADQGFLTLLRDAIRRREPFVGQSMSIRLRRTPGGPFEERFVDFVFQPILNAAGDPEGAFVEGSDVTDRVRGEARQKLLIDELNHRVKNTMATVQSIAAQTLRTTPDPEVFRRAFEARLLALSSTHNLLTETSWSSAALKPLLLQELRPHGRERYRLDGPDISLSPGQTLSLGLIFHELATNAAKYGALSNAAGRVSVTWRVTETGDVRRLELDWVETGGPKVSPPSRQGFGSRLIERSLAYDVGGDAALCYAAEGLRCRILLPLPGELAERPADQSLYSPA